MFRSKYIYPSYKQRALTLDQLRWTLDTQIVKAERESITKKLAKAVPLHITVALGGEEV
jgi:hypothetical protein